MGLIDSALLATGPWAMAGKALSYLVKLGLIIWWAMPVPALTPPSPAEAPHYSWYPDTSVSIPPSGKPLDVAAFPILQGINHPNPH
ncbi:hypothetical protein DSO57_1021820 [Entomophthora muscae]|uniref:Uncharacterized protein n=1 Tax=Entomophthora muscae TaxID=34485 RepID=A0ACC2TEU2_9FUNG|nr:hypothetical protein DSO57_1021820 [Entomophthora muscae]